jgi:hypothetical protein
LVPAAVFLSVVLLLLPVLVPDHVPQLHVNAERKDADGRPSMEMMLAGK